MCKWMSMIVDDEGKVYHKNGVVSHGKIEKLFKLRDNGHYAKVELTPKTDLRDVESWEFLIDEERTPDWWDGAYEDNVRQVARDWVKNGCDFGSVGGYLDLVGLTSLKDVKFGSVGGDLYLSGLTSLKGVTLPSVGGDLDLRGLTSLKDVKFGSVGGYLDLRGLTSLPKGYKLPKNAYTPNLISGKKKARK
jgi:hypothetical protein